MPRTRTAPATPPGPDVAGTKERILDIALDLFSEQGFDKTSLREIAERLGFSKAALYYHFASKEDILLALHLRLHELGKESLARLSEPSSPQLWRDVLDDFISLMMDHRKLFVLHERNQAAFENLHREQHDADHQDLEERFREVLGDPSIPVDLRVRLASALGAVIGGLLLAGDAFSDVASDELSAMLRGVIGDILQVRPRRQTAPKASA